MSDDWKKDHSNEAAKTFDTKLVQDVLDEFAGNMKFERKGLPEYGLMKIVNTVAQVARAQCLGFDPELLRLSEDEANAQMMDRARRMVANGKPVLKIDEHGATRLD